LPPGKRFTSAEKEACLRLVDKFTRENGTIDWASAHIEVRAMREEHILFSRILPVFCGYNYDKQLTKRTSAARLPSPNLPTRR
jgi:hypothetical protein